MKTINITGRKPDHDQVQAGVVNMKDEHRRQRVRALLTFLRPPTENELITNCHLAAKLVWDELFENFPDTDRVMIGGAPYTIRHLQDALKANGLKPVFPFSVRNKKGEFRHVGWVE